MADSYLSANFLTIKLIDYQNQGAKLEASKNPFASVILRQLAAIEAKNKPDEEKKDIKFDLTKHLYEKGFGRKDIVGFKFIDWLIGLPKPLELEYLDDVHKLEESKKMVYLSSAERFAMEKGIEKGKLEVAKHMLEEGIKYHLNKWR